MGAKILVAALDLMSCSNAPVVSTFSGSQLLFRVDTASAAAVICGFRCSKEHCGAVHYAGQTFLTGTFRRTLSLNLFATPCMHLGVHTKPCVVDVASAPNKQPGG